MKTLTFVIPVFNEEKRLEKTFKALESARLPYGLKPEKIIFVNDGSTDSTESKIKKWRKEAKKGLGKKIEIIAYKKNKGKGHAVGKGMKSSHADYTLFFDADISTPLEEIQKIAPSIKSGKDVIIGTRKNGKSTVLKHQPLHRELLGKGFTKITQIVLSSKVTDFTCGFKAFSKNSKNTIFENTLINGWGYDAEIIFLAEKNNFSITEVPVTWSNSKGSKVNLKRDVLQTLLELFKIRYHHSLMHSIKKAGALKKPQKKILAHITQ